MISCDPNDLVNEARCFKCLPRDVKRSVLVYLLCEWANATPSPPVAGDYLTDDQGFYITDDQGNRITVQL